MRQISLFEDENQVDSPAPEWFALPEECRVKVIRAIAILLCRLGYPQDGGWPTKRGFTTLEVE